MAGKTLCQRQPIDPAAIVAACFAVCPDPAIAVQRVRFGTSAIAARRSPRRFRRRS